MGKRRETESSRFALRRSPRLLGLSIADSGSGSRQHQYALRRSSRLPGIPTLGVPLPPIKPRKPRKPSEFLMVSKPILLTNKRKNRRLTTAEIARLTLRIASESFLMCHELIGGYPFGDVERACIYSPDVVDIYSEKNAHAGFTWVAVHGEDTTWAVFKKNEDAACRMYRNPGCWETFYYEIGSIAISAVEDLADKNSTDTPFAVVCVNSGTGNALEVSSEQAVNFVRYKTRSGFPDADTDNIQIAIGAFQLVCQQKLKASDIWVSVYNPLLPTHLFPSQIEEHLAYINTPGSGFYTEEHLADIGGLESEAGL